MRPADVTLPSGTFSKRFLSARAVTTIVFAGLGLLATYAATYRYYWPAANGLDVTGHPIGRDFINNWVGPRLAFNGEAATLFDISAYAEAIGRVFGTPLPFHSWSYPPFTLLYLWPFGQLPYFWALAAWTLIPFAAFAAVSLTQVPAAERWRALVLLTLAPACLINVVGGQNGFVTGALLVGGMLSLERRPWLAGILFGLLTFKPHLGLVLPFVLIALGAWRTIASACLTTLALVLASLAILGIEPWHAYLTVTRAYQLLLIEKFAGFLPFMLTSVYAGVRTFGFSSEAAWVVQGAVALPVLLSTVWAVRRTQDTRQRTVLVACAVPLLTPYAFNYDLTALAAVIVWRLCSPEPEPAMPRLFAGWLIPALLMPLNMFGIGFAPLVLLALYLTVLLETVSSAKRAAAPDAGAPALAPAAG